MTHALSTTDPNASTAELEPLRAIVGDAVVVGLARGAHGASELTGLSHRVLRFLVGELGFRSLAIEADWAACLEIDAWLQTGRGAIADRVGGVPPWFGSPEFRAVLEWLRAYNTAHPEDPTRLVGAERWVSSSTPCCTPARSRRRAERSRGEKHTDRPPILSYTK